MAQGEQLVVYGDFNCPFCYVLNEQLSQLGLERDVEWRPIEHEPDASFFRIDSRVVRDIEDEVLRVRQRAPEMPISLPSGRVNTRLATRLIITATRRDPIRAVLLRGLIYRAYWIEGRDISSSQVLHELVVLCGLSIRDEELDMADVESIAQHWYDCWNNGSFDRRIPSLQRLPSEQQFLGLPSAEQLQAFYDRGFDSPEQETALVCVPDRRQRLLVVDQDVAYCLCLEDYFADRYDVIAVQQCSQVKVICAASPRPDLILLNVNINQSCGFEVCRDLKSDKYTQPIPILLLTKNYTEADEIKGLDYGASDFLCQSVSNIILSARIKTHLQLARLTAALETKASFDSLTGLYNRREFERTLEVEWRRACRNSTPLSIMFMDIDFFKNFNDSYGHLAGDDCLRKVGRALNACLCRSGEFVARYGGEEFVAILPDSEGDKVKQCATRILRQIENLHIAHRSSEINPQITLSIGVATEVPALGQSPHKLLELADQHLYQAKSEGRNRVVY